MAHRAVEGRRLGIVQLGAPGGPDVEDIDDPGSEGADLGDMDIEAEVGDPRGDRIEEAKGVLGTDFEDGRMSGRVSKDADVEGDGR